MLDLARRAGVDIDLLGKLNIGSREAFWTKLWIYDLWTNLHFTLKENPIKRADLDDFVTCYNPKNRHERKSTWSEQNEKGRFRSFPYEELLKRDKVTSTSFG